MKKTLVFVFMIACMLCISYVPIYAQGSTDWAYMNNFLSNLGLSTDDMDKIKNLIDGRSQPTATNITVSPENPTADEPVSITATIVTPRRPNGEEVYEAYINYSTDAGKTMSIINMNKETEDGNVWIGVIPGQPSGTNLIFGIQAVNTFDEMYVETFCDTESIIVESSDKIIPDSP
ncbi:MAG TPA: hypothetical protein PKH33_17570 [bacterium]|nr:hypothetical protein [bacterium]